MKTLTKHTLWSACIFTTTVLYGQKADVFVIPKVTVEDLNSTKPKNGSDAPAEILYRSLKQSVRPNFEIETTYTERIKVYNKTQAAEYLNPQFTYGIRSEFNNFKATTYNLENNQIKETLVPKGSRFTTKENNDYIKESFAFENVKDGSIVELNYTIIGDLYKRYFQVEKGLPIKNVEYLFETPEKLLFNVRQLGNAKTFNNKIESQIVYGESYKRYLYQYKDVEAYPDENYVKNIDNYRTSINTELSGNNRVGDFSISISNNWDDVAKSFNEADDFGRILERYKGLKNINENFTAITPEVDRADAILKYVSRNYDWNGTSSTSAKEFGKLLDTKKGNSTEMNMLLYLLLKKNKIESNLVLLSTIDNGVLLAHFPSTKTPNYAIVAAKVDGNMVLMDANSKYSRINVIHPRALTYMGVLITDKKGSLINFSAAPSKQIRKANIQVSKDGVLSGQLVQEYDNFYSILEHEDYDRNNENYIKNLKNKWRVDLNNTEIKHSEEGVFEIKNNFTAENDLDVSSNRIILNPLFFLKEVYKFNQTTPRRSPIEFVSGFEDIIDIEFSLPEGYSLEKPFKPAKLKTDDGSISFNYTIEQVGDKLKIKSTVKVEDDTYDKEFYPIFKQAFDYINKVHNELIALVKK